MNRRKKKAIDMIMETADWFSDSEDELYEKPETIAGFCDEGAKRLDSIREYANGGNMPEWFIKNSAGASLFEETETVLKNMFVHSIATLGLIEAAESGYIPASNEFIKEKNCELLRMIDDIRACQYKKISGAATPEKRKTH